MDVRWYAFGLLAVVVLYVGIRIVRQILKAHKDYIDAVKKIKEELGEDKHD